MATALLTIKVTTNGHDDAQQALDDLREAFDHAIEISGSGIYGRLAMEVDEIVSAEINGQTVS